MIVTKISQKVIQCVRIILWMLACRWWQYAFFYALEIVLVGTTYVLSTTYGYDILEELHYLNIQIGLQVPPSATSGDKDTRRT